MYTKIAFVFIVGLLSMTGQADARECSLPRPSSAVGTRPPTVEQQQFVLPWAEGPIYVLKIPWPPTKNETTKNQICDFVIKELSSYSMPGIVLLEVWPGGDASRGIYYLYALTPRGSGSLIPAPITDAQNSGLAALAVASNARQPYIIALAKTWLSHFLNGDQAWSELERRLNMPRSSSAATVNRVALASFGAIQSASLIGVQPQKGMTTYLVVLRYGRGRLYEGFTVDDQAQILGMRFRVTNS